MSENRKQILSIRADYALLAQLRDFVYHAGTEVGLSEEERDKLVLAIDEAATNIITHVAKHEHHGIDCRCTLNNDEHWIICELVYEADNVFDPVSPEHEQIRQRVQEFKRGGYGLFLMHTLVDSIEYQREGHRNVIRLVKKHHD